MVYCNNGIIFIDYHGVLTKLDSEAVSFPPHINYLTCDALLALQDLTQYYIFIISNQVGVAMGNYKECELRNSIKSFIRDLQILGVTLQDFLYCPHHPEAKILNYRVPCACRKPSPFLLRQAFYQLSIEDTCSVLVGDTLETDIACAVTAGIQSIWINTDYSHISSQEIKPNYTSPSLLNAVPIINELFSKGDFSRGMIV